VTSGGALTATPSTVVRSYLAISALFTLSASVIWGVNTLFLLDAGLDIFEVFVANAAFTAGLVLFEVPTGVVADTSGRRRSFLWSTVVLLVGTLAYVTIAVVGGGLGAFVVASLVLGLGFSFYSGAVEAWLVDALTATGYDGQLDPVFARGAIVSGTAEVVGSVAGGLLGSIDLTVPFVVRSALLVGVFFVGWAGMHDVGFVPRSSRASALPAETKRVLRASLDHGWRNRQVRLLMAVSFVQGAFLLWAFYAWQPYFLRLLGTESVWVGGVIAALVAAAAIAGNGLVDFFSRFCGRRTTLLLASSGVLAIASVGVGVVDSFWAAVGLFLVAIGATGVAAPVQQAYLHAVVPSAERATVISSVSLIDSAGGIGGSLGLGYLSRAQSVGAGYVTGGLVCLLAVPPLVALRRLRLAADVIVGRKAGTPGPCAGQGLPVIASVDTTARAPEPTAAS
jgi:MFS family permease